MSLLCEETDGRVKASLNRPIEGVWPYVWIGATYVEYATVSARTSGWMSALRRRDVLDRVPAHRGLRGVKLVISDAHEGIKAAVSKVLIATLQRCRVHFMRNVLAYAGECGRRVVSVFATAFAQDDAEAARAQWRRLRSVATKPPELAAVLDAAEADVLRTRSRFVTTLKWNDAYGPSTHAIQRRPHSNNGSSN